MKKEKEKAECLRLAKMHEAILIQGNIDAINYVMSVPNKLLNDFNSSEVRYER